MTSPQTLPSSSRYCIASCIASGGMGSVYIGIQRGAAGFKRPVAIKRAHPYLLADPSFRDTILREARNASAVRHPNVVSVDDVEETDGELLLVMDYVEGTSLSHVLAATPLLAPAIAVRIVMDVCSALNAIHIAKNEEGAALGLVHRDVSPQNILVDTDGHALLTDFGIAKGDRDPRRSGEHAPLGKLGYMAPEYLRGSVFSPQSDIFGLGVVLWEAMTGRALFRGATPAESLRLTLEARVPAAGSINPAVPAALDRVLERCLAVRPSDRFANTRELHEALEASVPWLASREEIALVVTNVAGAALDEQRRAINLARLSARPPSDPGIELDGFVPGEADIFGSQDGADDAPPSSTLRAHHAFDLDDGLVPSARLAMPDRVSVVLAGEPRSTAMIALGVALVAVVMMSTAFLIQLGTSDETTSQVR